ncbi:MAG: Phosphoribosylglycinamide formyltransferase [Candidatus Thorarchaeota archaeon]|nr:MAG: Phosphoribosylglycinamide formyltransferase [Candidatus Thorarchaeota archaeon]
MKRIGVLISGRGTNLQALIDAQQQDRLGAEIAVVISNKSKAYGLERARTANISTEIVTKKTHPVREEHDKRVVEILKQYNVDIVVLAGYMRLITEHLIKPFENKIINIHPSLLPAFPGIDAQQQALDYGVKITGCTTHVVTIEMDAGPIILQEYVPIFDTDTRDTLAERILEKEHEILVETVQLLSEGKIHIQGRRTKINGE